MAQPLPGKTAKEAAQVGPRHSNSPENKDTFFLRDAVWGSRYLKIFQVEKG